MSIKKQRRAQGHANTDFMSGASLLDADHAHYGGEMHEDLVAAARKRPKVRPVSLNDMVVDERIQVRVGGEGGLDLNHVDTLVQVLINGGQFQDDIVLFYENEELVDGIPEPAPPYILADGFHRLAAYNQALVLARQMVDQGDLPEGVSLSSFEAPRCSLRFGTWEDAYSYAEEANLRHGQMLSNKDKKNILARRLERGHEWAGASFNLIAAELGVTDKTVKSWRQEIEAKLDLPTSEFSEVVGADGRVRDVSNIGPKSSLTPEQRTAKKLVRTLYDAADLWEQLGGAQEDVRYLVEWGAKVARDFGVE